jgi:hypothetical protein
MSWRLGEKCMSKFFTLRDRVRLPERMDDPTLPEERHIQALRGLS